MMKISMVIFMIMIAGAFVYAQDDKQATQQEAHGLDMVSDTVSSVFSKANALLTGNLEVTMSKDEDKARAAQEYTTNAIGQKVPRASATKSGGSLHSDQPL